ncbi:MAG: sensor domain-containing diguanylate cyclase [Fibrobacterota bacterium]
MMKGRGYIVVSLVLTGAALAAQLTGLPVLPVLLLLAGVLAIMLVRDDQPTPGRRSCPDDSRDTSLMERDTQSIVTEEISTASKSLDSAHQRNEWRRFEESINAYLDTYLVLVQERFNGCTAAIFLPRSRDEYAMRASISTTEAFVPDAAVRVGEGLLGTYLKDGVTETRIEGIRSTQQLAYYNRTGVARSLLMAPVKAVRSAGFIVVDAPDESRFSRGDLDWLRVLGELMGREIYFAYLYKMHRLIHEETAVVTTWAKRFMRRKDLTLLYEDLAEIFRTNFGYDRFSISLHSGEGREARVVYADGTGADDFAGMQFPFDGSSIAGLFYSRESVKSTELKVLCRHFQSDHYEVRYRRDETRHQGFRFFAAIPVGVDEQRGLILLESSRNELFSNKDIDTMKQLVSSASIAIEKIILIEKQENLAIRDGLTGLYNHRHFERLLHEAIVRSHRLTSPADEGGSRVVKIPVALIICDIDHFKMVNDTHGHRFGDAVLREIALTLECGVREGVDFAARYGGEEFALILYDSTGAAAYDTAERIRRQIQKLTFKSPRGEEMHVTMSFGVALYDQDAKEQEDLIQKADKALYRAKETGRNRVELFRPVPVPEKAEESPEE